MKHEEENVTAVLCFFMRESRAEDKRMIEIVSSVANQLGTVLQRKQAEAARRESEEQFRSLIESSPDAIIVVRNSNILYMNPAGLQTLGEFSASIAHELRNPIGSLRLNFKSLTKGLAIPEKSQTVADAFLLKSYDLSVLKDTIRRVLSKK